MDLLPENARRPSKQALAFSSKASSVKGGSRSQSPLNPRSHTPPKQATKETVRMFTMEQQLAKLEQEASAAQEFRAEARAALEGLRNGVGALKVELRFATSSMEELRRSWAQEVAEVRAESWRR